MKFGSLFSGIGGFDLALERVGMTCAWQVEIDLACQDVLKKHWPNTRRYSDAKTVGKYNLEPVDVICGGFPCQDLSVAGKRSGLVGERSGLWFEFARIIDELEPSFVVIENVPGLLSSNRGRDFTTLIQWLAKRGYGVAWRVLDAQYFGVPQRRRRVFIVGSFGNGSCAEVLFEFEGVRGNTKTGGETGEEIAYSLRANPSHSGDKGDGRINTTLIADTLTTAYAKNRGAQAGNASKTSNLICASLTAHHGRNNPENQTFVMGPLQAHSPKHGHAMTTQQAAESGQIVVGALHSGFPGRDASDVVNNHIVNGIRRLTPTECARLQGFPDDWNDWLSDSTRYRQYGNAVAVPVVEWIGRRIIRIPEEAAALVEEENE